MGGKTMRRAMIGILVLSTCLFASALPAHAAGRPTAVLNVSTSVQNGQKVIVHGGNWTPDTEVNARECAPAYLKVGLVACNGPGPSEQTTTGRVRIKIGAIKGSVGSVGYACSKKCIILLSEDNDASISAYAKFTFAPRA
jgi:hypothetical protein